MDLVEAASFTDACQSSVSFYIQRMSSIKGSLTLSETPQVERTRDDAKTRMCPHCHHHQGDDDDQVFVEALPHFQHFIHQAAITYTALTPSASNSRIFNLASRYIEAANASSPSRLHRPGNRSQDAEDPF